MAQQICDVQLQTSEQNRSLRVVLVRHAESENNRLLRESGRDAYNLGRTADPSLSAQGRSQADFTAKALATMLQTHLQQKILVACSAMRRSLETGNAIANECGAQTFGVWTDIHEEGGSWEYDQAMSTNSPTDAALKPTKVPTGGAVKNEIVRTFPHVTFLDDGVTADGWWRRDHVENDAEASERAERVVGILKRWNRDEQDCVVLVSHGAFLRRLLGVLLGPPEAPQCEMSESAASAFSATKTTDVTAYRDPYDGCNACVTELSIAMTTDKDKDKDRVTLVQLNSIEHLPDSIAVRQTYSMLG